jgi:hypothetical protein
MNLSRMMKHCKYDIKCNADDVQLYLSDQYDVMGDYFARLNDDLARIQRWSWSNALLLNPN